MVDSVPAELLELQTRFETWRANRKYVRESIPDELRSAALEALRSYPPSLVHRVLKLDPSRLRNKPPAKRSAPRTAAPKKKRQTPLRHTHPGVPKQKSKSSSRAQVSALPQPTFFKLPAVAAPPLDAYRLPMERLGYVFRADNTERTKRYFREAPGTPRRHIHVRRAGSWAEQFALLFRDYLRVHAEEARRYESLKYQLAAKYREDRHGYTEAKGPFIWEIMTKADRWSQEVGWEPGFPDA